MLNLSDDLIIYLWNQVFSDNERILLVKTCTYFKTIGKKIGYLQNIEIRGMKYFIPFVKYFRHTESFLKKLLLSDVDNPIMWLSDVPWPKEVLLHNCILYNKLCKIVESHTETLEIIDLHRYKHKHVIQIDWEKFPNLKVLDIQTYDINLDGLEYCKQLELIRIDLELERYLPSCITQLVNLKAIATTCYANQPYHFVSTQLKVCIIPKKYAFTCNSVFVPLKHIETNYINVNYISNLRAKELIE
jgi:hypothetical protein